MRPWPVDKCGACGKGPGEAEYGARGYCDTCYRRLKRQGAFPKPARVPAPKPKRRSRKGALLFRPTPLVKLAYEVGASETSRLLGCDVSDVHQWAKTGDVPDEHRKRIVAFLGLVREGWRPWAA